MPYKYHNFKITAGLHIAKPGHDSTSGTPDEPRRTPISNGTAAAERSIIGAGVYDIIGSFNARNMEADGKVIIRGNGAGALIPSSNSSTSSPTERCKGIRFENFNGTATASFNSSFVSEVFGNIDNTYLNVNGEWLYGVNGARGFSFLRPVFINCRITGNGDNSIIGIYCVNYGIIINSSIHMRIMQNSYVGADSTVYLFSSTIKNCCIQGKVYYNGAVYELKKQKDGSPSVGTDPAIPDLATAIPDIYSVQKSFNQDPRFNDVAGEDFTLRPDSPLIRADLNGDKNITGKRVATSISNADSGNAAGTVVAPTAAINTAIPSAYILNDGYSEGYVDYVYNNNGVLCLNLDLKALFAFNSDIAGGQIGNKNVTDAEPVTAEYAGFIPTTEANTALNLITVPAGKIVLGQHVRVNGQPREVISKATSGSSEVLTLDRNLLAPIGSGVGVTYGTVLQLAALNPNRLTVFMRTKSTSGVPSFPFVDSEWDNELDPAYGKAGYLFNQEVNTQPVLYIDGQDVYGGGDSDCPTGLVPQTLKPEWVHVRVYLRNNYNSKGVAL